MRKSNTQNGITLVALIITIVILLILAVVAIRTVQGDGIINYAQDAKLENEIAKEKEIIRLAAMEAKLASQGGDITQENMQSAMNKLAGEGKTEVADVGENLEVLFLESKRYYEVSLNGNVGEYNNYIEDATPGSITTDANGNTLAGTEDQPYEIWSIEDLVVFSAMVNGGYSDDNVSIASNQFNGKTVKLMRDLNFKSKMSYDDSTTTIYNGYLGIEDTTVQLIDGLTDTTKYKGFIPIGNDSKTFQGIFDGNNYTIKNLCENTTSVGGLFGNISSATIKNVTVTGKIKSTAAAGGIVGVRTASTETNIINCNNYAKVSGNSAGGIVGGASGNHDSFTIEKCKNHGEINATGIGGGIIGYTYYVYTDVKYCVNSGIVQGNDISGGMVGRISGLEFLVYSCINTSNAIIGKGHAGGFVGEQYAPANIYNSINLATIKGENARRSCWICY